MSTQQNDPSIVQGGLGTKTTFYAGFLQHEGVRIEVEFETPLGATDAVKDAAFVDALAQKATINYLAIGDSDEPSEAAPAQPARAVAPVVARIRAESDFNEANARFRRLIEQQSPESRAALEEAFSGLLNSVEAMRDRLLDERRAAQAETEEVKLSAMRTGNPTFGHYAYSADGCVFAGFDNAEHASEYVKRDLRLRAVTRADLAELFPHSYHEEVIRPL